MSIESSQEPKSKKNKAEGGEGEGKIFLNRETVTEGAASTWWERRKEGEREAEAINVRVTVQLKRPEINDGQQEAQETPRRLNTEKSKPEHIRFKPRKSEDEEKIFKEPRERELAYR